MPIVVPAPGRFSTTMLCPSRVWTCWVMTRAARIDRRAGHERHDHLDDAVRIALRVGGVEAPAPTHSSDAAVRARDTVMFASRIASRVQARARRAHVQEGVTVDDSRLGLPA